MARLHFMSFFWLTSPYPHDIWAVHLELKTCGIRISLFGLGVESLGFSKLKAYCTRPLLVQKAKLASLEDSRTINS